jgi:catechol 2,3-dioxygenase-like lactoylglutathione lyase family enzyme
MLANTKAMATIAVKDLERARTFYEDTLHLKRSGPEGAGISTYCSGDSSIVVYEFEFAGTNLATAVTWGVG